MWCAVFVYSCISSTELKLLQLKESNSGCINNYAYYAYYAINKIYEHLPTSFQHQFASFTLFYKQTKDEKLRIKGNIMAQWINVNYNNSLIWLPLLCKKSLISTHTHSTTGSYGSLIWYRLKYHTAQNFGSTKLWQIWNCKKIGGENFGGRLY